MLRKQVKRTKTVTLTVRKYKSRFKSLWFDQSSFLKYEMIDLELHFRLREIPEEVRSFRRWLRILLTMECFLDLDLDFSTL